MKRILLLLLFFSVAIVATSQVSGLRKVYAYAQGFLPGIKHDVPVIEGAEQQKTETKTEPAHERVSYTLYAEQSGSSKVSFTMVWIKGKAYPVRADKVITPVEMKTTEEAGDGKIVLAPASRQNVWALTLGTLYNKQPATNTTLKKLVAKNEVVLVYTWRSKVYYYPVKKIKNLPPAIAI